MIIAWSRGAKHGVTRSRSARHGVMQLHMEVTHVLYSHCSLLLIGFTCFCGSHSAAAMMSAICSAVMSLSTQGIQE